VPPSCTRTNLPLARRGSFAGSEARAAADSESERRVGGCHCPGGWSLRVSVHACAQVAAARGSCQTGHCAPVPGPDQATPGPPPSGPRFPESRSRPNRETGIPCFPIPGPADPESAIPRFPILAESGIGFNRESGSLPDSRPWKSGIGGTGIGDSSLPVGLWRTELAMSHR
jgi:hypothetical protein